MENENSETNELPPGMSVKDGILYGGNQSRELAVCRDDEAATELAWDMLGITPEEWTRLQSARVLLDRALLALEFDDGEGALDVLREWYASKQPKEQG